MSNPPIATCLKELDHLIQQQQWLAARAAAESLVESAATTPGVIERAMLVFRQLEDWNALINLLLEVRNRYQLWPIGSDLLMGQAMVEIEKWDQAIPYLELAVSQDIDEGWPHHFLGKALRHTGRLEESLEQQRLAAEKLPEFPWAPFEASQVLMELNQKGLAVLELYEARQRHSTPNLVMEEQWQKLQPIVLLSRIEQHQGAGDIPKAFALLRQAMSQTPDDEDLWAKLEELMLIKHLPADESKHNKVLDINALQRELNHIEFILDQLEATSSDNLRESSRVDVEGEISYL